MSRNPRFVMTANDVLLIGGLGEAQLQWHFSATPLPYSNFTWHSALAPLVGFGGIAAWAA